MTKELTKMPESRHRLRAELSGDSALQSLRFATLGWVPRKRERVGGHPPRHALCLLLRGTGTFLETGAEAPRKVEGPGLFFTSPGVRHDYGPVRRSPWEECYWIVEGPRVEEWKKAGWWPEEARFEALPPSAAAELWSLFQQGTEALAQRDGRVLDLAKLALERWLALRAGRPAAIRSPLDEVVESWRRAPEKEWSLREAAARSGMSYTRFRARFVTAFGTSPYDYLLRLRLELAAHWLRATDLPVKTVAAQSGFARPESFIRAFRRAQGTSPGRYRAG